MQFFGRKEEIRELQAIRDQSYRTARFFQTTGMFGKYHIAYKGLSMEDM